MNKIAAVLLSLSVFGCASSQKPATKVTSVPAPVIKSSGGVGHSTPAMVETPGETPEPEPAYTGCGGHR